MAEELRMSDIQPAARTDLPPGRLLGVGALSAAVLLLQLVQTRIFSVMLWHHLTYLVVTFTMLGFAAGGTLVACRAKWTRGNTSGRLALWSALFGVTALIAYALVTRKAATAMPSDHSSAGIFRAALDYAVLLLPMVFAGMAVSVALSDARGRIGLVYGTNMLGSGLGCLAYVPVLKVFGGEGTVLVSAALTLFAAAAFARGASRENAAPTSSADEVAAVPQAANGGGIVLYLMLGVVLVGLGGFLPKAFFEVPIAPTKAMTRAMEMNDQLVVEHTVWDPLCRLDVVGDPARPNMMKTIYQDGDAPTVLPMGAAHETTNVYEKEGLAYLMFRDAPTAPKALAIGIGGGIDVLQAAAVSPEREFPDGSRVEFTGVEINPTTADLMRGKYAEATANRYHLPGVTVHVDEGRSWLRRSDEKYDIIQMTGTDTYAALSSGSYVMSESYLYTAEAYDDFLGHLTDDGIISVLRFRFEPPRETLRLAAIAMDALRRDGAEHPEQHVVLLGIIGPKLEVDGETIGIDYGVLHVRKRPFTRAEISKYEAYARSRQNAFIMYAPGVETTGHAADYFAAVASGADEAFRSSYLYNMDPVTDDAPFFFRYHRWENVWASMFGADDARDAIDGAEYAGIVGGEPIGLIMLGTVLLQCLVLVSLLVIVPLMLFKREGLKVAGAGRWVVYFFGLGAGYMLMEIVVMQRFVLFLGHPGYAITVVLLTFLIFSGLGATVAGRSNDPQRTLRRAIVGVVLSVILLAVGLPTFFDAMLAADLTTRIALTVAVLAPVAFIMGMPFPSGLALISGRAAGLVPWAFGVNGGASVIASVVAILVAMGAGFSASFALAGASYLVALFAIGRARLTPA